MKETQALDFIKQTSFDGTGVIVAILDTGVDVGAPGLQITTDGRIKIIDAIDCTGSGDVCMDTLKDVPVDFKVTGLSGRILNIPSGWIIPSKNVRLGIKNVYELYPKSLISRLKGERKIKFEKENHALISRGCVDPLKKEDTLTQSEVLAEMMSKYEDPGYSVDCVVFNDGSNWRACVDINQNGELKDAPCLANYSFEHKFSTFCEDSMLNFSVNIYDNGEILSIVAVAGTHGTHVAAITAAHYPNQLERNGVAPGAQIVSLKIGDSRLGSMETGTGIIRAAIELCRLKCDLANISYGEAAASMNTGRFIQLLRDEVVNKTGCIVISSAGNAGPALTTVGAPGGTSDGVISVGAYVNHSMMEAEYAMMENVTERPYTWCSRGPAIDGEIGVDIYAPGAAITSVPQYTLQSSQLMNGTSMSSPNLCGCVALLLSGLKKEGISYTPYRIKNAIVNSSKKIDDEMNVGFIQVQKAWDYLSNLKSTHVDIDYQVQLPNKNRGIHLRDESDTNGIYSTSITVNPVWFNHDDPRTYSKQTSMEIQIILKSTQSWITCPEFVLFNNGGRGFPVNVDCIKLTPGFHFGQIQAYDVNQLTNGPLFSVPITVCKPEPVDRTLQALKWSNIEFESGEIVRKFVQVPMNANFAELIVHSINRDTTSRFTVHMVQLLPQSRYTTHETEFSFGLGPSSTGSTDEKNCWKKNFKVVPNTCMEICLAQFWSSLHKSVVDVEIKFSGVFCTLSNQTNGSSIESNLIDGNSGFSRIDLVSTIRKQALSPSISLDTHRKYIRPSENCIVALKSRDVLPNGKQLHEHILVYTIVIPEGTSEVTPRFPKLNDVLYDSCFENVYGILYDSGKKILSHQDITPKSVKLVEGTYTLRIQVIGNSVVELKTLKDMVLVLDIKLEKPVTLPLYKSLENCIIGKNADSNKTIEKGEKSCIWVGSNDEAITSEMKGGDMLLGKLNLVKTTDKVDLCSLSFLVPCESKKEKDKPMSLWIDEVVEKVPEKNEVLEMQHSIRDFEISAMKKLKKVEEKGASIEALLVKYPNHLPLLQEKVSTLTMKLEGFTFYKDSSLVIKEERDLFLVSCREILTFTDSILQGIDCSKQAQYFGMTHNPKETEIKSGMDSQKSTYLQCIKAQIYALAVEIELTNEILTKAPLFVKVDSLMNTILQWSVAPAKKDGLFILLWSWRQVQLKNYGSAIKCLTSNIPSVSAPKESERLTEYKGLVLDKLNWGVWKEYEFQTRLNNFPKSYAPF